MTFQVPAILTRASSLKDGGLSLGFHTQEMSHEDMVKAMELSHQFGWLLFRPEAEGQFTEDDLPKGDPTDESKSPSQRLRAVLFVLYKQQARQEDFDSWYRKQVEKFIDVVKEKLV